jgi:hypothetical protein
MVSPSNHGWGQRPPFAKLPFWWNVAAPALARGPAGAAEEALATVRTGSPPNKHAEVRSELRWWYDGIYVTGYSEGLCGRWNGWCWNPAGPLYCYWDTHNMPYEIDIFSQSSFTPYWGCPCPGCGGWVSVDTSGGGSGAHGAYCQHDFNAPPGPGTIWYCYQVHL